MKRLVVALLLASTLCMTGCGDTKKTEPAASTTEEVDKASSTMKEQMGDNAVLPSDSVKRVMAKQWKVIGKTQCLSDTSCFNFFLAFPLLFRL